MPTTWDSWNVTKTTFRFTCSREMESGFLDSIGSGDSKWVIWLNRLQDSFLEIDPQFRRSLFLMQRLRIFWIKGSKLPHQFPKIPKRVRKNGILQSMFWVGLEMLGKLGIKITHFIRMRSPNWWRLLRSIKGSGVTSITEERSLPISEDDS